MTAAEFSSMKKTKSVNTICAIRRGVIQALPRKHERTKCQTVLFSCFRVFVASRVRSYRLPRAPLGGQRAASLVDVGLVFVPEVLQRGLDRRDRRVAEGAEGLARDVRGDPRQQIEVAHLALAALDPVQDLVQPVGALAARRAFSARLVTIE